MSDTPETDAAKRKIKGFADEWVPRYVSEQLERERNELLAALEKAMLWVWNSPVENQNREDMINLADRLFKEVPGQPSEDTAPSE